MQLEKINEHKIKYYITELMGSALITVDRNNQTIV